MNGDSGYVSGVFNIDSYVSDEGTPDKPLKGQQFALTGIFAGKDRFHIQKDLRDKGAIVRNRVAPELRALIVGETVGPESPKMRWAKRNGVPMISWDDFARSFYKNDADVIAKLDEAAQAAADNQAVSQAYAPAVQAPASTFDDGNDLAVTDGFVHPADAAPAAPVQVDDEIPVIADEDITYCECGAVATVHVPGGFSYCADCANLQAGHEEEADESEADDDTPAYNFAEGDALAGECYVIAGTVSGISSNELTARLQAQGAIVADTVTIGVDAVIKGDNLGDDSYDDKLAAAERYDVPLIAYSDIQQHL